MRLVLSILYRIINVAHLAELPHISFQVRMRCTNIFNTAFAGQGECPTHVELGGEVFTVIGGNGMRCLMTREHAVCFYLYALFFVFGNRFGLLQITFYRSNFYIKSV
jgi:hypothetical protein